MSSATLLVELLTEELPPKALARLGREFADAVSADLRKDGFLDAQSATRWFATPRRLAAQITAVRDVAPDQAVETQGPSVKVGLDAEGKPTPALLGFARKNGVPVEALERRDTPKGAAFVYRATLRGATLDDVLAAKIAAALKALPIPKVMRWGSGDAEFVRPAHGFVMLHGERVIPGAVLGLQSGRTTSGHRFVSEGRIDIQRADDYEHVLRERGGVIASFDARREVIRESLLHAAGEDATADPRKRRKLRLWGSGRARLRDAGTGRDCPTLRH